MVQKFVQLEQMLDVGNMIEPMAKTNVRVKRIELPSKRIDRIQRKVLVQMSVEENQTVTVKRLLMVEQIVMVH